MARGTREPVLGNTGDTTERFPFGIRACVVKSTSTRPEALQYPSAHSKLASSDHTKKPLSRNTRLPGPQRGSDVDLTEEGDPSRIVDLAVRTDDVVEGGAALRDRTAGWRILAMHAQQQLRSARPAAFGHPISVTGMSGGTVEPARRANPVAPPRHGSSDPQ